MHYVLYVPGMSFNGETLARGKSLGGSESAGYYLARELARRGHEVTVFGRIGMEESGEWDGVRYLPAGPGEPDAPLGANFQRYLAGTPVDVVIGQRVPGLFEKTNAAKVTLWWTHDLALKRFSPEVQRQMWNMNGVLCVSAFHKAQVGDIYGLDDERITVVPNGVERALFTPGSDAERRRQGKVMVYSSRPERGLENLVGLGERGEFMVKPGTQTQPGIMEILADADPDITLKVCGYENTTPEMAGYYAALIQRCQKLPNVEWLGALSKAELARLMSSAWLQVYPTTFEEVSCITAMESQCAGTPIITTPLAALPETLSEAGAEWVRLNPEGQVDRKQFAQAILQMRDNPDKWARLNQLAEKAAPRYEWRHGADAVENLVASIMARQVADPSRMARHLMRNSDIYALKSLLNAPGQGSSSTKADGGHKKGMPVKGKRIESRKNKAGSGGCGKTNPNSAGAAQPAPRGEVTSAPAENPILAAVKQEMDTCYAFAFNNDFSRHYREYYAYEAARGVTYGPENLEGNPRFETVARQMAGLPAGSMVLDYGCAHGHYTINLARRYPGLRFMGVDLVETNIQAARKWADSEGIRNVEFACGNLNAPFGDPAHIDLPRFDAIIAAEVLEHVPHPGKLADDLAHRLKPEGVMLITTPYGPWEAPGYQAHHPWRAHLHHLELDDLRDLFGHHPGFGIMAVPAGGTSWGETLGSYITLFRKPTRPCGRVDLPRKLARQKPRQTLSACLLVRSDGETLARTLKSIAEIADEILIGVDTGKTASADPQALSMAPEALNMAPQALNMAPEALGRAGELAALYGARAFAVASPLQTGFDQARNTIINQACGDWILWIDDDEELLWPENLPKYLRDNPYDAYALRQHHYSVEPGGVIKTDYPCRVFRNRRGFSFYGMVHEHPELGLNQGAGKVMVLPDTAICHNGYVTESVRRARFQRNLPLMEKDRERYKDRLLGRFLWVRDLAHLNRFQVERSGQPNAESRNRAEEAIALWRALLDEGHLRMAVDALPYYSECVQLLTGSGLDCAFNLGMRREGVGDPKDQPATVQGVFMDGEDVEKLTMALLKERTTSLTGKYL